MATSYHVRLRGKVHGPFNAAQLKKLVQKGQITEDAEISQDGGEKWYSATKVAGLFDDAPAKAKTSSASDDGDSPRSRKSSSRSMRKGATTGRPRSSTATKKRTRKAKAVIEADDVFDLDSDGDDEFDDVDFVDGDDAFEDLPAGPPSKPTKAKPKRARKTRGSGGSLKTLGTLFGYLGLLYAVFAGLGAVAILLVMGLVPGIIVGISAGLAKLGSSAAFGRGLAVSSDYRPDGDGVIAFGVLLVVIGIGFIPILNAVGPMFLK